MDNQRLVDFYQGQYQPQTMGELIDILTDASKRQTHGNRDDDVWENGVLVTDNSKLRIEQIRSSDLNCHCRYISKTMVDLFKDVGVEARLTEWMARTGKPGDFRHTTSEIYFDGQYVHADVDIAVMFMLENYLSSLDLKIGFDEGSIDHNTVRRLCSDKLVDESFPLAEHIRKMLRNDDALLRWCGRMSDSLMIGTEICTGNNSEHYIEPIRKNVVDSKKNDIRFLTLEEFREQHYQ